VPVADAAGDPELISVDFVVPGSGGDGSGITGPCSGDTVPTGTIINNGVGNVYSGQVGAWNPLNIGTYNQTSASSGFLTNGAGALTTVKLVLGLATGVGSNLAGGWRCDPNSGGTSGATQQLRAETAYLNNGVITGDHYAWAFTGLIPNALYQMTLFGGGGSTAGASNVANGVAGSRDTEGDWNWTSIAADSNGTILGTFTAPNPSLGLFGAQLKHVLRTQPPQSSPGTPLPADAATNVPSTPSLSWSDCLGVEAYDVYLWPASDTAPALPTATAAVSHYAPPGFLLPFTHYSWRVVARNSAGTNTGPVWSFTTNDGHPLAAATPTPAIAATGVVVDSVLDWGDSLGATSYQIYIWPASDSKPATPTASVSSSTFWPPLPLAGNSLYNWQVVAVNQYGPTPGPVWTFTTGDGYPGYLVPWPKTVTMGTGTFVVTAATRIVAEDASLLPLAQVMAKDLFMAAGLTVTTLQGTASSGDIALRVNPILTGEAYTLEVNASNIILSGGTYQAAAWASVTLLQALDTSGTPAKVAQMSIADQPAAPLRTVMWDVARYFHPLETLYELVDLHRMYKVTYMHLYLSANGLFTFGSTIYPGLAKTKNGSEAYAGSPGFYLPANGTRLYYTKAELTGLVAYAKDRGVVIVPEIDTPAWAGYMTGSLPATFCSSTGTTTSNININYPAAITAMDELIGELAAVFTTSPYIHIGADEVGADFTTYPNWSTSSVANNYSTSNQAMVWYMSHLNATIKSYGKSSWAWSTPGVVGKGYDMPTDFNSTTAKGLVYTGWGYDDGANASSGGYSVMRAAGGHVAGMGQANRVPPYNRCLLYRPAEGIYNRLTPLLRFISAPDNMYTDLTPTFMALTGRENKIVGAHIMEWETPYEAEVPAMRLSMPALGEPTWNQESSTRRNWANFQVRQAHTDQLYQRVMRPVSVSVSTQVDPKDVCFVGNGMVTMTSPVAGTIRYTVGTDYKNSWYNFPTSSSTAYTAPFAITQSSVICARLFDASGNPLGNPVTRGFYLITPKTHYKYYFTGGNPAADFEKGAPIVSSVMGQMDGDAPQEDVRFGDSEHRTVYSGALTIPTTGAYTFSASYGGTITIDRAAVSDGTAVTLTAGEHIFKIVTPASSLGTPYTFSGPGFSAGNDLNILLETLTTASQVFPASYAFGSQNLSAGATALKEITIVNHSPRTNLTITSVVLDGTNPGEFIISADSGETVLAPGAERIVAVRYNPTVIGSKTATLHVVAAALGGGFADVALSGTAVGGSPPSTPATPLPVNGAIGVVVNPTLDWANTAAATSYDVYLWLASGSKPTTPTATVSVSQWTPSFNLTTEGSYNWQVVATNVNGSTAGPQWSFHVGNSTVQISNLADGQVMRYPMVLVDGAFDGGTALTIMAAPIEAAVSFTKYGSRFRCLVDLRPGTNTLTITDGHGTATLNLVYTPPTATSYRFKVWYVVPSDEANSPLDPDWFVHFGLQTKLMQSWMAEDQKRAGNGRETFYPLLDGSNNVAVEKLVVTQTRAEATTLNTGMYGQVWNQIPAAYKDGLHKNLVFSSVAPNALGGGDLCYVGAYGGTGGSFTNLHPADATQMMSKLLSTQTGNDGSLTYSTYTGVTLHEICHCIHSIWHDTSANNIMGGGGYNIAQYFTLTYSDLNSAPHNESSAGTLGVLRDLAAWNRYLMNADPHTYNNTTVGVTAGSEYLTATSPYPLAVFQYYIPGGSADLHANLVASNVTTYSKHAGQARLELGASPFNIMAVDTQGNMSYTSFTNSTIPVVAVADSYTTSAAILVTAAPGVLGNDVNPSGSALSATLVTDVLHGTLALSPNGGFTYTPTVGFLGTDTFTYKVSDGISSDQQAVVTLTVTPLLPVTPATPEPAGGASAVAVVAALDWADSPGATGYDVYLWQTSQAKPATRSAAVVTSNYVPPANLLGTTAYSWQVVATNAIGSTAGPVWTFTTAAALPPTVAINSPSNNDVFLQGTAITIVATAADDGAVARVDFYADGALLGSNSLAPFNNPWNGAAPGAHVLTAVATDNAGLSTTSAAVTISVIATVGVAETALCKVDLNGNRGTANTGPVHTGWTSLSGTQTAGPFTVSTTLNGIAINLGVETAPGVYHNAGWRNRTFPNAGPLSDMYQSLIFAAGGFDLTFTGLTIGQTYRVVIYSADPDGANKPMVRWQYSAAGSRSAAVDAGYLQQPLTKTFTPQANTDLTTGGAGMGMLSTTFVATTTTVNFFTLSGFGNGSAAALNGFELYTPAGAPYQTWAASHAPIGAAADDYDGDGVSNALEFVLGGTKDSRDLGKLPRATTNLAGDLVFTFKRTDASQGGSTLRVETSPDLLDWTTGYDIGATSSGVVTVTENGTDPDDIAVTIPQTGANKFVRLKVTITN